MNYTVIILISIVCTIVTLFLIKESFTSKKRIIFAIMSTLATCTTLVISFSIVFISFKQKEKELEYKTIELQNNISILEKEIQEYQERIDILSNLQINSSNQIDTSQTNEKFIIFDNVSCKTISKNFNDTEIDNTNTKFVFYNHPENLNEFNTLSFSFMLDNKYNIFSTCINVTDNVTIENTQATSIQIFADEELIYSSEELDNFSMPLYLDLDINNVRNLSFSISTNMIDTDKDIFRTISFSETKFELKSPNPLS